MRVSRLRFGSSEFQRREDESALDALIRGGADVDFSCRKGSCHTCLLRAAEGDPGQASKRGLGAQLIETGHFLPCLCHSTQDLVLEPPDRSAIFVDALVAEKKQLSPRVMRLWLEPATQIDWTPGQYVRVRREDGLVRSYSVASLPDEDYYIELHVQRVEGGELSGWIFETVEEGQMVQVQGPLGECVYNESFSGRPLTLIGTGTGLAPLVGIARDALRLGHEAAIDLYHGARDFDELYLHETLNQLAETHSNFAYHPCLRTGHADSLVRVSSPLDAAFDSLEKGEAPILFLCGNPAMVQSGRVRAVEMGLPKTDTHVDPFDYAHEQSPSDKEILKRTTADPELWRALDEGKKLRTILEDFYRTVYEDPRLSPFFHNVTRERAISKQYEFLADVFSGEIEFFGLKPFNAHHWMVISEELFDYRESLFEACLRKHELSETLIRRWLAFHERFRPDIVKSSPRGMFIDGIEHRHEGFSDEELDFAMVCDGCAGEMPQGSTGRLHRRTGKLFCANCSATQMAAELDAQV